MYPKRIIVAGGDPRQLRVAERFAELGAETGLFAMEKAVRIPENCFITENLKECGLLVLPLPTYGADGLLNAPLSGLKLAPESLISALPAQAAVVGGMLSDSFRAQALSMGIAAFDYFGREELTVANAVPTAEGAIQLAMENTAVTLHGAQCLVTGFGRVGGVLAHKLDALDARVTVSARKYADLARIEAMGLGAVKTGEIGDGICKYDVIFNTIPYRIFDKALLSGVRRGGLIIDLASKPGGVDMTAARELGVNVIWALSLPGKVAPYRAGDIIFETVLNIMSENEAAFAGNESLREGDGCEV